MTDTAHRAASWAVDASFDDAPPDVRDRLVLVLLDTVGVCLRGSETDYVRAAASDRLRAGDPAGEGATAFAAADPRPPAEAAFLNASGGTTLELDEGNQRSAHMGIHTVPPALAVAEADGADGATLLDALLSGYEVGARLGDANRPMRDGLHPHGGWAPVSGAVAVGRLLGLETEKLAHAIRIAVNPLVATHWRAAHDGATVRDFYTGTCCAHGVRAATLAGAGVTGMTGAIEDCLLPTTAGRDEAPAAFDAALDSLGEVWYLRSSYVKVHAACRYAHAPLDALAAILDANEIASDDIDRIEVRTFALGATLDERAPVNVLAAKFSTPYALAARTILGRSDAEAFTPERVEDDRIRSLAGRVDVVVDDAFDAAAADGQWGAEVTVELVDGETLTASVADARGGGDSPFTRAEILDKFDSLVGPVLGADASKTLRERLLGVETCTDVGSLL